MSQNRLSYANRGFTLIELIVVVAIIGFVASVIFAALVDARLNARDQQRIQNLQQIERALHLYANDHATYPREADGANGNIATNATLRTLLAPYLQGIPVDPAGFNDDTFFYYYDGSHTCGTRSYAVIFARQMDLSKNANYSQFLSETCGGTVDGEGRGGGQESFNIRVGPSGG